MSQHKHNVETMAEQLALQYTVSPPVDVDRIAQQLGLPVFTQQLQQDVSGLLIKQNGQIFCFVNSHDHRKRQRFTIGHELGHFVLGHLNHSTDPVHIDKGNYAIFRDSKSKTGLVSTEVDANQFSAALLMPRQLIESSLKRFGSGPYSDAHVTALAEEFNVSEQAMALRLARLKYI